MHVTTPRRRRFKVAAVQTSSKTGDSAGNASRLLDRLEAAVRKGARLIVLPELCTSGYAFRNEKEAVSCSERVPDGPSTKMWAEFAKAHDVYIVGGLCEHSQGVLHNSAVLVGPSGYVGTYRKTHLWDQEKRFFVPGSNVPVFDTSIGSIGIMICYDNYFPEMTRCLASAGASVVCHPLATDDPFDLTMDRVRSMENAVPIAASNLSTRERGYEFAGGSQVTGPGGTVLASAGARTESVVVAELGPDACKAQKRLSPRNEILLDRRKDLYGSFEDLAGSGPRRR